MNKTYEKGKNKTMTQESGKSENRSQMSEVQSWFLDGWCKKIGGDISKWEKQEKK